MDCSCRNEELLSCSGMANLAIDLELYLAFKHENELIRVMDEILPALPGRVDPQIAAEAPGLPVSRHIPPVYRSHHIQQSLWPPAVGVGHRLPAVGPTRLPGAIGFNSRALPLGTSRYHR